MKTQPKRPTKLLFLVNDLPFFFSHRLPLALAARARGWSVVIATPAHPQTTRLAELGLGFEAVALNRSGTNPLAELGALASLITVYRRVRPDLAHHVTIKPVLYGGLVTRLLAVPAVVSAVSGLGYVFISQGRRASLMQRIVRGLYRVALRRPQHCVIFQNPDDLDAFLEAAAVVPEQTVMIRGSGVDLGQFRALPEPPGAPVVMLPSRLLWDKGVGEFVEAARTLRGQGVNARFVLVGDSDPGNPAAIPDVQLQAWREEGVVEWWGRRDDMPVVLAQAHLVVLPSYREGLPKVLLEAAACGRALVAADVPGCREICRDGDNGLLAPARESAGLAQAIGRLLADADLRQRMGARGRAIAEAEFSIERVVAETLALYDRLLLEVAASKGDAP